MEVEQRQDARHPQHIDTEFILRMHPVGVVPRQRRDGDSTYLVVTGLRSWQVLEALRRQANGVPRLVPVQLLKARSADEIRAIALADVILGARYFAIDPSELARQTATMAQLIGLAADREFLTPAADLDPHFAPAVPRKRGRPRKSVASDSPKESAAAKS